ncbi:MAG: ATP-binding protein [Actinomycetota bacterium]
MRSSFKVSCDPEAPFEIRRKMDALEGTLPEEAFDDLRLLTNELVTNCVLHTGAPGSIEVNLAVDPHELVRVEVIDPVPDSLPRVRSAQLDDTSGRGLALVDAIADRWGVRVGNRKAVWFELDIQPEPATKVGG